MTIQDDFNSSCLSSSYSETVPIFIGSGYSGEYSRFFSRYYERYFSFDYNALFLEIKRK